jgi:hypothetical protein
MQLEICACFASAECMSSASLHNEQLLFWPCNLKQCLLVCSAEALIYVTLRSFPLAKGDRFNGPEIWASVAGLHELKG